jgi:hypothetical protein
VHMSGCTNGIARSPGQETKSDRYATQGKTPG